MDNMARLERIVSRLPEADRVDIEDWGAGYGLGRHGWVSVGVGALAAVVLADDGLA